MSSIQTFRSFVGDGCPAIIEWGVVDGKAVVTSVLIEHRAYSHRDITGDLNAEAIQRFTALAQQSLDLKPVMTPPTAFSPARAMLGVELVKGMDDTMLGARHA